MGRPAKDYTGKKINKWTVVGKLGSKEVWGKMQPTWLCRCECGTEKIMTSGQLRNNPLGCFCVKSETYRENLTGQKFDKLTVIEFSHTKQGSWWKCVCECGKERVVAASSLRRGQVKSCKKCKHKKASKANTTNEVGNIYGSLTVLEYIESRGGEAYWLCECSCGNLTEVRGSHLRSSGVQRCDECGTQHAAQTRTVHGLSGTNLYARFINRRRRTREKEFDMWTPEMEDYLRTVFNQCVLCGMTQLEHQREYGTSLHTDHVRPLSKGNGLEPGNATLLCATCNREKHDKDLDDLSEPVRDRLIQSAELFKLLWDNRIHATN